MGEGRTPIPAPRSCVAWLDHYIEHERETLAMCHDASGYDAKLFSMRISIANAVRNQLQNATHRNMHSGEARLFKKLIEDAAIVVLQSSLGKHSSAVVYSIALGIGNRILIMETR